jgi:hypothetical protein
MMTYGTKYGVEDVGFTSGSVVLYISMNPSGFRRVGDVASFRPPTSTKATTVSEMLNLDVSPEEDEHNDGKFYHRKEEEAAPERSGQNNNREMARDIMKKNPHMIYVEREKEEEEEDRNRPRKKRKHSSDDPFKMSKSTFSLLDTIGFF